MRTNNKTNSANQVNATATATIAAPGPDRRLRVQLLVATVSAGAAVLTLDLGGGVVATFDVTPGGPIILDPDDGMQSQAPNVPVTATLSAAGVGNTGRVTITAAAE